MSGILQRVKFILVLCVIHRSGMWRRMSYHRLISEELDDKILEVQKQFKDKNIKIDYISASKLLILKDIEFSEIGFDIEKIEKIKTLIRRKHSEKTKNKLSESHKMLGYHHSEETKIKIRDGNLGKRYSDETKKKISIGNLGKIYGKETREKMRIARSKRVLPYRDTGIEKKIQSYSQQLGIIFDKHRYMKEIEHAYQCDIFIPNLNMVIECDGDYTHCNPMYYKKDFIKFPNSKRPKTAEESWSIDKKRTLELIEKGFKVLRLWESEINIMNEPKQLLERIEKCSCQ